MPEDEAAVVGAGLEVAAREPARDLQRSACSSLSCRGWPRMAGSASASSQLRWRAQVRPRSRKRVGTCLERVSISLGVWPSALAAILTAPRSDIVCAVAATATP